VTNRVVVQVENFRNLLATHAVDEQQQCIRSPRQACLSLPTPHQRDEIRSDGLIKKTAEATPCECEPGRRSTRSGDLVSSFNPCCLKIQTIGNRESNGITPTNYSCRRLNPGRS
jgi:hypothetical protein